MTRRDRALYVLGVVLAASTFLTVLALFTNGTPR